jgi:hypothetical protein
VGGEADKYYVAFEDAFSGHLKPERAERSILYRNAGQNRFVNVSRRAGLDDLSWSGDASAIDVNDDGWLDLYVLNMLGDNNYYENVGGTRFVKKSRQVFPRTSWGAMGIKVFDFNNDGRFDIFITDMHSDMSEPIGPDQEKQKSTMKWPVSFRGTGKTSIWGNSFFLKEGPGKFREVSDAIGAENYCPWGPSGGDLNADGFDDTFIASGMNYPERYMINSVKLNDRGVRFIDAEFLLGIEPRQGGNALVRAGRRGQGQGASGCGRRDGARGRVGRPRHPRRGHLRSRRRRRSRHRHQRVQRRADGARQQPERKDAAALPRGQAHRDHVQSRRARRDRQGDRGPVDLHQGLRR